MLELRNVTFAVADEKENKEILKDVNLSFESEKFIVVTGPNGGGKSTLAKIIMGIEKPTSGKIFWEGEDITDWDIYQRARAGISFALQQPVRFKGVTVKDLISLAANDKNLSIKGACNYLAEVGLCANEYVEREVDASLSGGELKRIEIATILARKETKMAIFDEPEAGIDLWSFQKLIKVFEKMHTEKKSLLIISHQERILNIADEIIIIAGGKVTKRGKKQDLFPQFMAINGGGCNLFREVSD